MQFRSYISIPTVVICDEFVLDKLKLQYVCSPIGNYAANVDVRIEHFCAHFISLITPLPAAVISLCYFQA
jgi:hypothetical protein